MGPQSGQLAAAVHVIVTGHSGSVVLVAWLYIYRWESDFKDSAMRGAQRVREIWVLQWQNAREVSLSLKLLRRVSAESSPPPPMGKDVGRRGGSSRIAF